MAENKKLAARLASEMPETRAYGAAVVALPLVVPHIVRGLFVDRTSNKLHFQVSWFCLPMCWPLRHLIFNFGETVYVPPKGAVEFSSSAVQTEEIKRLAEQLQPALHQARAIDTPHRWCARWPLNVGANWKVDAITATVSVLAGREVEERSVFRAVAERPPEADPVVEKAAADLRQLAREALAALDLGPEQFKRWAADNERVNYELLFPGLKYGSPPSPRKPGRTRT